MTIARDLHAQARGGEARLTERRERNRKKGDMVLGLMTGGQYVDHCVRSQCTWQHRRAMAIISLIDLQLYINKHRHSNISHSAPFLRAVPPHLYG